MNETILLKRCVNLFLSIFLTSAVCWGCVFGALIRNDGKNKITLFILSDSAEPKAIRGELSLKANVNAEINWREPQSGLDLRSISDCDVCVLPVTLLNEKLCKENFLTVAKSDLDEVEHDGAFKLFSFGTESYGIVVYDADGKINLLKKYAVFSNEKYVLLINKKKSGESREETDRKKQKFLAVLAALSE